MAVFRVEKNKGFTVMSNYHLKDKRLSLKAKGLLSQMLSLPENWDYTLRGLVCINKEKLDAIRTAVLELENHGYITRQQSRDNGGIFANIEYIIYEQPQALSPCLENPNAVESGPKQPCLGFPNTDNPNTDKPNTENPTQLNTDILKKEKSNIDVSSTHQSIYPADTSGQPRAVDKVEFFSLEFAQKSANWLSKSDF